MAQTPVPRPPGRTPAVAGGERSAPGSIDYVTADAVGFEHIPAAVVDALAGVLVGPPIAADADPPVAKRRSDGTCYQQATGWWAGGDRYVTVDARRPLAPGDGQKLKPVSGWRIDGTVSHFNPRVITSYSQWRFDPGGPTTAGTPLQADDPLDVLPGELTRPIRDADASAWRVYGRGWAEETIVASLNKPDRVLILKAQRRATSRRALDSTDWHAVTLDAPIVWVQDLSTDSNGQVVLGDAVRPPTKPPGPAPGPSVGPGQ
ncbi:MAG: hypothetical protein ACRDY2_01365 [Acidimicrobiales bacterium]